MKNIGKKWDREKVFHTPYDPVTGVAFLGMATILAVLLTTRSKADWCCTWQFILVLVIMALAFSVLVLCMIVRNAIRKRCCLTWLESDSAKKMVWFAMVAFVVAPLFISSFELFGLKDAAGFKNDAMNLAIVVVAGFWVLIWLFGTNTFPELLAFGHRLQQAGGQPKQPRGPSADNDESTDLEIKSLLRWTGCGLENVSMN